MIHLNSDHRWSNKNFKQTVSVTLPVIWSVRHVEDDARLNLRRKHCCDSCWLKYPEVWRFHHTVVINRRRMLVWYLAIARIKGSQSRVAVITQWAALFLDTHTLFFFLKPTPGLWNLPCLWADGPDYGNSHGGIFQKCKSDRLLNILPVENLNQPLCENIRWRVGGGRQRGRTLTLQYSNMGQSSGGPLSFRHHKPVQNKQETTRHRYCRLW